MNKRKLKETPDDEKSIKEIKRLRKQIAKFETDIKLAKIEMENHKKEIEKRYEHVRLFYPVHVYHSKYNDNLYTNRLNGYYLTFEEAETNHLGNDIFIRKSDEGPDYETIMKVILKSN